MADEAVTSDLIGLLNEALARELQVSVQYMLQHATEAGRMDKPTGKTLAAKQSKFVASHSYYMLPGVTLKKIAITEMRHAEAISERVVALGGRPTTQPAPIVTGETVMGMLEDDREQERGAIALYTRIIGKAEKAGDAETAGLFRRILTDEEGHHRVFNALLAREG